MLMINPVVSAHYKQWIFICCKCYIDVLQKQTQFKYMYSHSSLFKSISTLTSNKFLICQGRVQGENKCRLHPRATAGFICALVPGSNKRNPNGANTDSALLYQWHNCAVSLLKWGFWCATEAWFSEKVIEGTWVPRHKDLFCSYLCLEE